MDIYYHPPVILIRLHSNPFKSMLIHRQIIQVGFEPMTLPRVDVLKLYHQASLVARDSSNSMCFSSRFGKNLIQRCYFCIRDDEYTPVDYFFHVWKKPTYF